MPNNLSIKTDYPKTGIINIDYPKARFIQNTSGQFVGTATAYNDSTVTYSSASIQYGGHDGNDGPGPRMGKIIL